MFYLNALNAAVSSICVYSVCWFCVILLFYIVAGKHNLGAGAIYTWEQISKTDFVLFSLDNQL